MRGRNLSPGEHAFHVDGLRLRYRVAGRGPPLVVQPPGWGIGSSLYEATLAPLERDFTVVYPEPRGSGASDAPADAKDLHVGAFGADLEALRAHLGLDAFALAGHSHGGLIALHYALRHPARVTRLMPLDAQLVGVAADPREAHRVADARENPELKATLAHLDSVGGLESLFALRSDEEATAFLQRILPVYFRDVRHSRALEAALASRDLPVRTLQAVSAADGAFPLTEAALRALPVPALVVSGRYDLLCPPGPARRLADTLPCGQLAVFEASGHFPWLEEPERFFALATAFLSGRTPDAEARAGAA